MILIIFCVVNVVSLALFLFTYRTNGKAIKIQSDTIKLQDTIINAQKIMLEKMDQRNKKLVEEILRYRNPEGFTDDRF